MQVHTIVPTSGLLTWIPSVEVRAVEKVGDHTQCKMWFVHGHKMPGTLDCHKAEVGGRVVLNGIAGALQPRSGEMLCMPRMPVLLDRKPELARPLLSAPVRHARVRVARVDEHAVFLGEALVQRAEVAADVCGPPGVVHAALAGSDVQGRSNAVLCQPTLCHGPAPTGVVIDGPGQRTFRASRRSQLRVGKGGRVVIDRYGGLCEALVIVLHGTGVAVAPARVVNVVNVEFPDHVVHLMKQGCTVWLLHVGIRKRMARSDNGVVQRLADHCMPVKEFSGDLLALSRRKRAHAHGGTPAAISNRRTFKVWDSSPLINLIHEHGDVDASIRFGGQIQIILFKLGICFEECNNEIIKVLGRNYVVIFTLFGVVAV
eukprot:m.131842 g.131842  ORF g.131842 m.131842 type:complete len:372 (+) comp17482_c0_seq2:561-1676(+)